MKKSSVTYIRTIFNSSTTKCRHCGRHVSLDFVGDHLREVHKGIAEKIDVSMSQKEQGVNFIL